MVQRVESIILKGKNLLIAQELCHKSKNLYNASNYEMRQSFINCNRKSGYSIITEFTKNNQTDYRSLPAHVSQSIINLLEKNWKSFFKLIKDYKKNQSKYKGRPKLPKYKDKNGLFMVIFDNCDLGTKLNYGYLKFPKGIKLKIKTRIARNKIIQVRLVPQATCIKAEIVYEREVKQENVDNNNNKLSIDLGVGNLATMYNNVDGKSFIINGKPLKSINQFYNKKRAQLQSYIGDKCTSKRIKHFIFIRNNKVKDYMHKVSKYIVQYCLNNNIGHLIVGNNKNWKQEVELGKVNNQHFVEIPFLMLQNQLKYKCEDVGIVYEEVEESYTSKIDHFANETMEHHDIYLGKRVKRGLFKSSANILINADVNGAIGIMRKVINDVSLWKPVDSVVGLNPVRITPTKLNNI